MSNVLAPFQLLELNVISAQDLAPVTRNMRTYAVAWVHPDRKLSTRVDTQGHTNPTWNDKFVFRVDEEFLYADTSAIMIEIYALHWFKDVHVGTVRVLVGNLIPPPPDRPYHNNRAPLGMRFVALQVRRASGRPQGILNIGVAVLDSSMRSMPLYTLNSSAVGYRHLANRSSSAAPIKPELRRTKSDTSSMMGSEAVVARRSIANKGRANSAISESVVSGASSLPEVEQHEEDETRKKKNKGRRSREPQIKNSSAPYYINSPKPQYMNSPKPQYQSSPARRFHPMSNRATPMHPFGYTPRFEYTTPRRSNLGNFGPPVVTESELGPSASEVAAEMARNPRVDEEGASTVGGWSLDESVEGLESKLDRWRTELPPVADRGDFSSFPATSTSKTPSRRSRRNTDSGLFSCFSTICGVECGISCGSDPKGKKKNQRHGVARSSASADETSFL
ncbi:hypothetical protein Ahy_A09g042987 isoform A [Arachis hypogaea]|uniref:C2 domain-containing protein n=1 Tax=Arachis hypogaea TaxID=3818 RepID=A0A445BH97_ARAHY|nr:hypothetical protein Ahy_A09g042987 isoform A [Arachis hypogaea]